MLLSIMAQKIQMDDTYTYTCIFEHISSSSIAHMSTTHQSTNMCRRCIYMTAVSVHQSNLRKTGVLKLLQDKTTFNKYINISDSPNILTDKPPNFLKYSIFSYITVVRILKKYIKMVFYKM